MAASVKDNCRLLEHTPVAASVLDRTTLQHIAAGASRHRTIGALG
jgi:hypothetical protein